MGGSRFGREAVQNMGGSAANPGRGLAGVCAPWCANGENALQPPYNALPSSKTAAQGKAVGEDL
eukprot:COSAG04_NODE_16636_length_493_cov_0.786802_1_plen_63_part_10